MAEGTRSVLVPGCPRPAQPTTPSSGMCGSGAGNSRGSPSQLGTAFPYKAGPRGEEPARDAPRSCHEAAGWDPHNAGEPQWRALGAGAAGLGWTWGRHGAETGRASLILSSQARGWEEVRLSTAASVSFLKSFP